MVDDAAHRVVMLTAQGNLALVEQSIPIGHQVVDATVSPDSTKLFVLSAGDWPRRTVNDQLPSLTVIDFSDGDFQAEAHVYPMSEPLGSLALDPQGNGPLRMRVRRPRRPLRPRSLRTRTRSSSSI